MKKLELKQMENLNGGLRCFLMGMMTGLSWALGPGAALAAGMYTIAECAD